MRIVLAAVALAGGASVATARAADTPSVSVGLRLQGWYVAERHGAADGGRGQDFLLRREPVGRTRPTRRSTGGSCRAWL